MTTTIACPSIYKDMHSHIFLLNAHKLTSINDSNIRSNQIDNLTLEQGGSYSIE